jgi:hypothetical protein
MPAPSAWNRIANGKRASRNLRMRRPLRTIGQLVGDSSMVVTALEISTMNAWPRPLCSVSYQSASIDFGRGVPMEADRHGRRARRRIEMRSRTAGQSSSSAVPSSTEADRASASSSQACSVSASAESSRLSRSSRASPARSTRDRPSDSFRRSLARVMEASSHGKASERTVRALQGLNVCVSAPTRSSGTRELESLLRSTGAAAPRAGGSTRRGLDGRDAVFALKLTLAWRAAVS